MAPPHFDEEAIQDLATDESYYRGEEYLESGAVRSLVLEGDTYRAQVQGTRRYTVKVWEAGGQLQTSCTCPYEWGGICKHIVATMLAVLQRQEEGKEIKRRASALPEAGPAEPVISLDQLLASLSAEQLKAFVRLQAAEYPQVAENLRIFSQGATPTDKKVEEYKAEITAVLEEGDFTDPEEHYYYEDYEPEEGDTAEDLLQPHFDLARRYLAQGNWIESAKIQEAVVRACSEMSFPEEEDEDYSEEEEEDEEEDDEDEDGEEDFYAEDFDSSQEFLAGQCEEQAEKALLGWADALAQAASQPEKIPCLTRLLELFAAAALSFPGETWEAAFKRAISTAAEAQSALAHLKGRARSLEQNPEKAGALLHLLELSGDTERFIAVGKKAMRQSPHLALPLCEKLATLDKKGEAIQVAEAALKKTGDLEYWYGPPEIPEALRRFLCRAYDPKKQYQKLVACARELLFAENKFADYVWLRDLLRTQEEREELIHQVKSRCAAGALIEILSAEERWKDLLDCARRRAQDPEFPKIIQVLQERFPAECFKLYRQVLLNLAEGGSGHRDYRAVVSHAQRLQKIPGCEEEFARLMGELVERFSRRPSLMRALGPLAELGRQWRERGRRERLEKLTAKGAKGLSLEELAEVCPVREAEWAQLRGYDKGRAQAILVWAVLKKHGGKMEAADLTEIIAAHRKISPQSAAAMRSSGLKALESLGYVEVEREGNRLRQVRLTQGKG